MSWAQRLKRVFGIDIETCPACGGAMRIIVCIEDPAVIEKILTHLDAKAAEPQAPRRPPCRAPPQRVCSTDSDHLMSTTLVCDASGAATVAAGLGAGKC